MNVNVSHFRKLEIFYVVRFVFAFFCLRNVCALPLLSLFDSNSLYVPLLDGFIFKSSLFICAISATFFVSISAFSIGYKVRCSGTISSLSQFYLLIVFPAGVLSFTHLFPLGCLAFAFSDMQKNPNHEKSTPLVFLISSVYLTAALQKFFHFELMHFWLPKSLMRFARDWFLALCPSADCLFTEFIAQSVVPVELLMAVLFLIPTTRIYGYILAVLFHTSLGTMLNLRYVGFFMLLIECAIAVSTPRLTVNNILNRKFLVSFFSLLFLLTFAHFLLNEFEKYRPIDDFIFTVLVYFPLIFFSIYSLSVSKPKQLVFTKVNYGLIGILIFYAMVPVLDGYRKFHQWGWSMFSGSRNQNRIYSIKLILNESIELPNYFPLISKKKELSGDIVLSSTSQELLNRYKEVIQKNYPKIQIEIPTEQ